MKKSFTLIELIIVIIIVSILVSFAVPEYINYVERTKGAKAKWALGLIAEAEKLYWMDHGFYVDASTPDIDNNLQGCVEISDVDFDQDWSYTVDGTDDTFTATATRLDGSYKDRTISLDESGNWTNEDYP